MSGFQFVTQQNRAVRACGGLQQGRHLARVQRSDARVGIAGHEEHSGILGSGLNVLVGRVSVEPLELGRIVGGPLLRYPELCFHEFLIAQHVEQRIAADHSLV